MTADDVLESGTTCPNGSPHEDAPALRLKISPEPTDDERDAIVAALTTLATVSAKPPDEPVRVGPTPWMRAAREEAVRGIIDPQAWRRG